MIEYILNPQSVEALGWTLLHSVWQGAVFAILLVLILITLRSYSAQSRYVVSVGLLAAFFLTLSGTFWLQWQQANSHTVLTAQQLNVQPPKDIFSMNNSETISQHSTSESNKTGITATDILASEPSNWLTTFKDYYTRHLPLLVTIWFLGVLFLQLRFLGQLAYVQRLKHYGTELFPSSWKSKIEELEGKLRIQKKVNYLTSIRIESPMVIGWLKPVVLMPKQLLNSLSETEIYAVLAHELAHIRREDFIVNLMQTFLCNVFFFHPGIWWMSNRIDDEREHCCDDLAVAATGPATSYAKTLINVSEFKLKGNTALSMAFSGKNKKRERGGFSSRIKRLFMANNGAGSFREGFATAFILITALFLGVVVTGSTLPTTDSANPSETIITETNDIDTRKSDELNQRTEVKTIDENDQISEVTQDLNLSEIPITNQPEITASEELVKSIDTRVDALVMACGEGDFDFVKTLVQSGIDINGISSEGFTPLMMAVNENEAEIVEYLIKQGADVNQSYNGWTALIEAADEGSLASMKQLIKAGADVNFYSNQGNVTAISMAASEGKLDCLKLLLNNGADINGIGKSIPPLHMAANEGKSDIIDFLITKQVNVNKKDAAGRTALMYAASEGKKSIVKKLMEAGADNSIVDINGTSASEYAEAEEEYDLRDFLSNKKRPAIHQATLDGRIEKVERMVEQGTDVNTTDDYGRTPLHIASAEGHNIDMLVLINLGADLNAQDKQGRTPLMYAAADGQGDAVALLVSRVADVNIQDVDGMRAFEWAQSGGNSDLINFFGLITEKKSPSRNRDRQRKRGNRGNQKLQNKQNGTQNNDPINTQINTNINTGIHTNVHTDVHSNIHTGIQKEIEKDIEKREWLHIAKDGVHLNQFDIKENTPKLLETVRNGSIKDCAKLISNGMPVNIADDTGQTALMIAASTGRLDMAALLIKQGADVNMSSSSGLTALHYAALENHDQIARLLLQNNAKVDATMRYSSTDGNYSQEPLVWVYDGATPLLIAVESSNTEVISVLLDAGARTNHKLTRTEYRLNKDQETYLSGSEVMGLDEAFLKKVKIRISDDTWTPYKQALLLNKPEILSYFQK